MTTLPITLLFVHKWRCELICDELKTFTTLRNISGLFLVALSYCSIVFLVAATSHDLSFLVAILFAVVFCIVFQKKKQTKNERAFGQSRRKLFDVSPHHSLISAVSFRSGI